MTRARQEAIEDAQLIAAELHGILDCLHAYAADRSNSIGGALADGLAGCERLAREIGAKLEGQANG